MEDNKPPPYPVETEHQLGSTASTQPQPGYTQASTSQVNTDDRWILSYRDFVPQCTSQGGILTLPTFEPFP